MEGVTGRCGQLPGTGVSAMSGRGRCCSAAPQMLFSERTPPAGPVTPSAAQSAHVTLALASALCGAWSRRHAPCAWPLAGKRSCSIVTHAHMGAPYLRQFDPQNHLCFLLRRRPSTSCTIPTLQQSPIPSPSQSEGLGPHSGQSHSRARVVWEGGVTQTFVCVGVVGWVLCVGWDVAPIIDARLRAQLDISHRYPFDLNDDCAQA